VIASMLALYMGYLLDEMLQTPPTFMLGLFFLAAAALHRQALQGMPGNRIPEEEEGQ